MRLLDGQPRKVRAGQYIYDVNIGTGTASLEIKPESGSFRPEAGFDFSASTGGTIFLPDGEVRATLTGDAVVHLSKPTH